MSGPLEGLRVLDFGHSWAGPYAGMMLRDLGADVLKVESADRPEILRVSGSFADDVRDIERCGWFATTNRGKRSFALNLKHPGAAEVVFSLVERCDIVIENFAPDVLPNLGITVEQMRERNPRAITISMSGYGSTGPEASYRSFGDHLLHASGIASLTGAPEDPHTRIGIFYGDPIGGMYAVLAILSALRHRDLTGEGATLELSQVEGLISMIPTAVMKASLGEAVTRSVDKSDEMHPHGFYRCLGTDTWVAIAVRTEEQWAAFREVLRADGVEVAAYPSVAERLEARAAIDEVVEAWTQGRSPWQVTEACQARGIAAYPVQPAHRLLFDDHLAERGFFKVVKRPITGSAPVPGVVFRVNGDGARIRGHAPTLGEHNEYVYRDLLGYTQEEFEQGVSSGLIR